MGGAIKVENEKVKLYPNPANTALSVELSLKQGETATICLYNNMGQLVECEQIYNNITSMPTGNLTAGIYYYRIIDNKGNLLKSDKQAIIH